VTEELNEIIKNYIIGVGDGVVHNKMSHSYGRRSLVLVNDCKSSHLSQSALRKRHWHQDRLIW